MEFMVPWHIAVTLLWSGLRFEQLKIEKIKGRDNL